MPAFILLSLCLLVPTVYRLWRVSSRRRSTTTTRSNGLPVHSHSRSLSRSLFGNAPRDDAAEMMAAAEDQDSTYPTFPFSPSVGMDQAYHSGLSGDELPTYASPRFRSDSDEEMGDVPAKRVRRVSRVWAWEAGGSRASTFGGEEHISLTPRNRAATSVLARLNSLFRPLGRALRRSMVRRILVGGLGKVANRLLGGTVGQVLKDVASDVGRVIGWGVGWWVLLFWWFGS